MILEMKPLSLAKVKNMVKDLDEKKILNDYLKKFCKIDEKKFEELSKEIKSLDNLKIKEEHLVKIADFLPKDGKDVNKIFNDVSLNEEEINAILDIVKKY